MSVQHETAMKLPYQDGDHIPFEEYFPERSALEKELERLNQVVKAHKSSEIWQKFNMAVTSSTEYGGRSNYNRKQTPRTEFFNPWYQSSREIGKYNYLNQNKKETERLFHILEERKKKNEEKASTKRKESKVDDNTDIKSESHAFTVLPPIQNDQQRLSSTVSDPIADARLRRESKFREPAMNFQYMEKPVDRLLKNMKELPKDTGVNKRISPKTNRNINRSMKGRKILSPLKIDSCNHSNPYGLGQK